MVSRLECIQGRLGETLPEESLSCARERGPQDGGLTSFHKLPASGRRELTDASARRWHVIYTCTCICPAEKTVQISNHFHVRVRCFSVRNAVALVANVAIFFVNMCCIILMALASICSTLMLIIHSLKRTSLLGMDIVFQHQKTLFMNDMHTCSSIFTKRYTVQSQ